MSVAVDVAHDEDAYCGISFGDFCDGFLKLCLVNSPKTHDDKDGIDDEECCSASPINFCNISKVIIQEEFHLSNSRRVIWGYLLGAYTSSTLEGLSVQVEESRKHYWTLVDKYDKRKRINSIQSQDPQLFHPLAPQDRNPWAISEKLKQLLEEIWQDIERTYQERALFQKDHVRKSLQSILYVWSMDHDYISYKQGMNDLLALVYIACYRDQVVVKIPLQQQGLVQQHFEYIYSNDLKDIEADAFTLYNAMMHLEFQMMFEASCTKRVVSEHQAHSQNLARILANNIGDTYNPLWERCNYIFHELLKEHDFKLYEHLKKMDLEPHLFLMRWLRVMFTREFHVEESLALWDYIFADHFIEQHSKENLPRFQMGLIDYFAVAMLMFVRENLLEGDVNFCLQRLFKYPPIEDVSYLLSTALKLKRPKFLECISGTSSNGSEDTCVDFAVENEPATSLDELEKVTKETINVKETKLYQETRTALLGIAAKLDLLCLRQLEEKCEFFKAEMEELHGSVLALVAKMDEL